MKAGALKEEKSHIFERAADEWYCEPEWCSARLFQVEQFVGTIADPSCGFGRIVESALAAGLPAFGSDLVNRGYEKLVATGDFFQQKARVANIVSNPPFDVFKAYALHALGLATQKVALIWLVRTLPAARWLEETPLKAIYFLTPLPSMPPGHVIASGQKPGGGKQDFCWLVWDFAHTGPPVTRWLRRDQLVTALPTI